jgi:methylthioribose-1-phosphate isomerase
MIKTLYWKNNKLYLLDQTLIPHEKKYYECNTYQEAINAIKTMKVRGAPAIGVTAAYAMALAEINNNDMDIAAREIRSARPTAVNLMWAVDKVQKEMTENKKAIDIAHEIYKNDVEVNHKIGQHGLEVIKSNDTILTHCNAGALACSEYGTALGVIRAAYEKYKNIDVICDETRPVLQGARLSVWEMQQEKIPVKLIVDGASGYMMMNNEIDKVVIGADRVCSDGIANKIGSLMVALACERFDIPFYVASPMSTFDNKNSIYDITIEQRNINEVLYVGDTLIASENTEVVNPAFDIVPKDLITGIITEEGIKKL